MSENLIDRALSERGLKDDGSDTVPFLNREAIPLLRDIRTVLNDPDHVIEYTGAGSETITLPSAATSGSLLGAVVIVVNNGTGAVTVAAAAGETVNGAASVSLTFNAAAVFIANGETKWRAIGGAFRATSLTLSGALDVTGTVTSRGLLVHPGATTGSVTTVQLIGDLRQVVFGTSNAVIVGSPVVGGGLLIGSTSGEKVGLSGATPTARLAAVTAPAGGATVDTECRAAVVELIDRIKTKGVTL